MRVAYIDEARCIGCALCVQACPVDAIVGAPKRMHTVVAAQCTGCDLCLPPCPVDCIEMRPAMNSPSEEVAATRRQSRLARLAASAAKAPAVSDSHRRKAVIAASLARTRAKRAARSRA